MSAAVLVSVCQLQQHRIEVPFEIICDWIGFIYCMLYGEPYQ